MNSFYQLVFIHEEQLYSYIGTTTQTIEKRLSQHKRSSLTSQCKLYLKMRELNIDPEDLRIFEIRTVEGHDNDIVMRIEKIFIQLDIENPDFINLNTHSVCLASFDNFIEYKKDNRIRRKAERKYYCETCDYNGEDNYALRKHCRTQKHIRNIQ